MIENEDAGRSRWVPYTRLIQSQSTSLHLAPDSSLRNQTSGVLSQRMTWTGGRVGTGSAKLVPWKTRHAEVCAYGRLSDFPDGRTWGGSVYMSNKGMVRMGRWLVRTCEQTPEVLSRDGWNVPGICPLQGDVSAVSSSGAWRRFGPSSHGQ